MVTWRLFMLILCCDGPFWTACIGCVLFFFMVLRSPWHMVCSFLFDFISHRHTISKSVQSTCTCPVFGASVWNEKHSGMNSFFGMDAFHCLSPDQSSCPGFGAFVWNEKHSGISSFFGMDAFHCLSPDRRLCWHCHYQHLIIWSRNNGAMAQRWLCSELCARITSSLTYTK